MVASEKIIVYSCITGGMDSLKPVKNEPGFRYFMFTDSKFKDSLGWEIISIKSDNHRKIARYYKHNPHLLFPDAEYSIWLDGTHWPYQSLVPLIDILQNNVIAASRHGERNLVQEEAKICSQLQLDSKEVIDEQVKNYLKDGFQDKHGLYETSYLIRRHSPQMIKLQEFWWQQQQNFSIRDQISLPYCLWKLDLQISVVPGVCRNGFNPFFKMRPHRKNAKLILI
jgi:hypothetical protein